MFTLNSELFPAEVEYTISEETWKKPAWNLRQVRIQIDGDVFAVVNCSKTDEVWNARFIILRAEVASREMDQLHTIITKVQAIMPELEKEETTIDDIKKLLV